MYLNNLQSYIFGGILIFMVCLVACEKSTDEFPSVDFGKPIDLGINESVSYKSTSANPIKLKLSSIIDNFCPKEVICITAGYAEVKLSVSDQKDHNVMLSLFFGHYYGAPKKSGFKPDTLDFNLNRKEYRAILKSIKSENNDKKLKAEIVLIEK